MSQGRGLNLFISAFSTPGNSIHWPALLSKEALQSESSDFFQLSLQLVVEVWKTNLKVANSVALCAKQHIVQAKKDAHSNMHNL